MYRTLMVPLDGSELSARALPVADTIARRDDARLHLVHVASPAQVLYIAGLPVIDEQLHSLRRQHEQAYLDQAVAALPPDSAARTRTSLLEAPIVPALLDAIAREHVDLVVLTSHGAGGFERAWLGSVTDALIRHSSVPVLVVPADSELPVADLSSVLVPLDGSAHAAAILPHALAVGGRDARYTLAAVLTPFDAAQPGSRVDVEQRRHITAALAEHAERLRAEGYAVTTQLLENAHPAAALLDAARAGQHSLIALTTHGRGGIRRRLLGSVADKLVRAAQRPVLVYRPPAEDLP
jgi:nucleotide-binding universal stress UspA family protein